VICCSWDLLSRFSFLNNSFSQNACRVLSTITHSKNFSVLNLRERECSNAFGYSRLRLLSTNFSTSLTQFITRVESHEDSRIRNCAMLVAKQSSKLSLPLESPPVFANLITLIILRYENISFNASESESHFHWSRMFFTCLFS